MSEYTDTGAVIKTALESITDIGIVHDRFRYVTNAEDVQGLLKVNDDYRGVMFRRIGITPAADEDFESDKTYVLLVMHAINDEENSEKVIQEIVDLIIDKFQGMTISGYECKSISMQGFDDAEFGNILVHQATMQLVLTVNNF